MGMSHGLGSMLTVLFIITGLQPMESKISLRVL